MYKLLIVDDEALTREGLQQTVDWQSANIQVVGVAENGQTGLEAAHRLQPDLIIADVRMPVMDGLEMAEQLFRENSDLSVIVLSGYADFENARRALDFGVASFLLKPIDNGELLQKAEEVLAKLEKKRAESAKLGQLVDNLSIIKKHRTEQFFAGEISVDKLAELGVDLPVEGTLVCVKTATKQYEPFISACEQCLDCSLVQVLDSCAVLVVRQQADDAVAAVNGVLRSLLGQTDVRYNVSAGEFSVENRCTQFETVANLCQKSMFFAVNSVVTEDYGNFKKLIRDALAIIERDYGKKISVKSVAYDLYTSESTLMHEFKSQTGKTFNECLTDYRMAKAKEFLLAGEMRVGEIGYAVGYTDVKYFGQVFKEYFGCTPSEFLENNVK